MLIEKAKSRTFLSIIAVVLICMTEYASLAITIPHKISYQGKLIENGVPVTGTKTINFSFIDTDWEEIHQNVNILNGMYSVVLGSIIPIPVTVFGQDEVRLRIIVNGIELKPDVGIFSVGSSFVAKKADYANKAGVADRLSDNSIYVNQTLDVGIGTNDPQEKLDIDGAIKIGSTEKANPGTIRYTNSDFQGFDGKKWTSFSKDQSNGSVISAIAGENINGSETPIPVYMRKNGEILSQIEGSSKASIFGVNRYAQIFKTDKGTSKINKIALNLETKGNLINALYSLSIQIVPLVDNKITTTNSIATIHVLSEKIVNGWNDFIFENEVLVMPLKEYAIIAYLPNADSNNLINWIYTDSNKYEDGYYASCSNFEDKWSVSFDKDFSMKIYGNNRAFISNAEYYEQSEIIGFAISESYAGEQVFIQTNGILQGFNNLSVGLNYYLQDTKGKIGLSFGFYQQLCGKAINEKELVLLIGKNYDDSNFGIPGEIKIWSSETPPHGWLICNGSAISRKKYKRLFDVINTKYGNGDNLNTFNIPDLKGRIPVGFDSNDKHFETIGKMDGEKEHLLTIEEMPSHSHEYYDGNGTSGYPSFQGGGDSIRGVYKAGNTGGNQPHNNLQPYIVLIFIIKY